MFFYVFYAFIEIFKKTCFYVVIEKFVFLTTML